MGPLAYCAAVLGFYTLDFYMLVRALDRGATGEAVIWGLWTLLLGACVLRDLFRAVSD